MTVIYIDRVFALNLVLDYMLLLICARLAGTPLRRLRFLLCAAGGAFYAAAVFLPGCAALNGPVFRLLAGLAMSLAAFWCEVRRWRLTALFFLVSGALAGLLLAVGLALGSPGKLLGRVYYARVSWPVLLGTALGMSLLLRLVFGQAARHGGNEIMSITISLGGKCCTVARCSRFRTARSATAAGIRPCGAERRGEAVKNLLQRLLRWIRAHSRSDKVMYIGGSDTLPQPLPRAEEAALIARLADSDPAARQTLIERNLRLVVYIARRFENTGINIEDLISIGTIGLIKAINTFRADKNIKLATYASRCIENEILMYLRKNSSQRTEVSLDEPLNTDWDGKELLLSDVLGTEGDVVMRPIEADVDRKLLRDAVAKLSGREQEIITMRFGLGGRRELTQKEVADRLGISQSYISRLEKRIITRLRREIVKMS